MSCTEELRLLGEHSADQIEAGLVRFLEKCDALALLGLTIALDMPVEEFREQESSVLNIVRGAAAVTLKRRIADRLAEITTTRSGE